MGKFEPMEILREETSRAVMGALLIHDLRNPKAMANPKNKLHGNNPIHLMMENCFHGGIWRLAYKFDTIGSIAAGSVYLKWYLPYVAAAGLGYRGLTQAGVIAAALAQLAAAMDFWSA